MKESNPSVLLYLENMDFVKPGRIIVLFPMIQ